MNTVDQIRKKYGEGAIYKLSDNQTKMVPAIPTGSLGLDVALGIGGVPKGRIIEIYGPESSGKTTLCQHIIAEAQALGNQAAFVDVEHSLDPQWAEMCGVNIDDLFVSQPDTGEQALEIVEMVARGGEFGICVVDSVAALVPRAEIEGEMGDSHMGLQARLMSQAMRKLSHVVKTSNISVIFINQLRHKIGVMFGSPETTTGGQALKYYASVRIDLRKSTPIKDKDEIIGNVHKVTVKKNKVAPPYKKCEFKIYFNQGISYESDLIDYAIEFGVIEKGGAGWFTMQDGEKVQGEKNLLEKCLNSPDFIMSIDDLVRERLRLPLRRFKQENVQS